MTTHAFVYVLLALSAVFAVVALLESFGVVEADQRRATAFGLLLLAIAMLIASASR